MTTRRTVLWGLGIVGAIAAFQTLAARRLPDARVVAHPRAPGFRLLQTTHPVSATSAAGNVLIGLDPADTPDDPTLRAEVEADPDLALFGHVPQPAMAYFTDILCPSCRSFEASLDRLQAEFPQMPRITQEFPVFGERSERAARALIAVGPARATDLRARLRRGPAALEDQSIIAVVEELRIDPAPVLAAMYAPETERRLAQTRALAGYLGLIGTPSLVLGRTVMSGAVPLPVLRDIASAELA